MQFHLSGLYFEALLIFAVKPEPMSSSFAPNMDSDFTVISFVTFLTSLVYHSLQNRPSIALLRHEAIPSGTRLSSPLLIVYGKSKCRQRVTPHRVVQMRGISPPRQVYHNQLYTGEPYYHYHIYTAELSPRRL